MWKTIQSNGQILFGGVFILLSLILGLEPSFGNPEMTQTQLFLEFWGQYLGSLIMGCCGFGIFIS